MTSPVPAYSAAEVIAQRINKAIAPFETGNVSIFTVDEPSGERTIYVKTQIFPGVEFVVTLGDVLFFDPDKAINDIAEAAASFFRNLPALPVDDNIILGTD